MADRRDGASGRQQPQSRDCAAASVQEEAKAAKAPGVCKGSNMGDYDEITQLIMRERQGRDRAWWRQMQGAFWPEATVRLSWIDGTAEEFVEGSKRMAAEGGGGASHRLSLPSIHLQSDRAVIEAPAVIQMRIRVGAQDADLTSSLRLLYRAERRAARWGILRMDAIYERDEIKPSLAGDVIQLDPAAWLRYRTSYRALGYYLDTRGIGVPDDLYGADQPDELNDLYRSGFAWAGIELPDLTA